MSGEANVHAGRRELLKLLILAGLIGPLAGEAAAQEQKGDALLVGRPLPAVDTRFPAEIASGVFILPDRRIPLVPNIGIIIGAESALVVDCGLGLDSAESVLKLVRELAPGRRVILTVTHAHPEHGFGAQLFRSDARIYYNAAQRDYLLRAGNTLLAGFRSSVLSPAHRHLLDGVTLVPPHDIYDGPEAALDLGGREVRMRTWGTAHSPGDQIVFLPRERILFAGDLLEERMFPIVPFFPPMIGMADIDVARWETALGDMVRLQPRLVVPGHGNLAGVELPEAVLGYFKAIRETLAQADGQGGDAAAGLRARYPSWENPEFIGPALEYFRQRV